MAVIKTLIIAFILVITYSFFESLGYYGIIPQIFANIGLIPVLSIFLMTIKEKRIDLFIFLVVIYQTWNMFLQPFLWTDPIVSVHKVVNPEYMETISISSCLSVWTLYFGFLWFRNKHEDIEPFFTPKKMDSDELSKFCLWALLGGYICELIDYIARNIGVVVSFFSQINIMLPATVAALYTLYLLRGGRNYIYSFFIILYLIYNFIYYVGGTLFIYSIILFIAPVAIYVVERGKIPIIPITILVILLMPIYLSRHEYRNIGLYSRGEQRIAIGLKILENEYLKLDLDKLYEKTNKSESNIDNRFEGVSYLSTVMMCHKELDYPYNLGKTFVWLPTMIIPRFLIPFRPSQNMGDEWAVYYHVKDPSWNASINFPMLVEFYANFGVLGMLILSFISGSFICYSCKKFADGIGDINLLLLIFILPKLIVIEANITLAYGMVLQVMFVCWLVKRFHR